MIREKLISIEWRTKAFVWVLFFLCLISILFFWALLAGFRFMRANKPVPKEPLPNPFMNVRIEAKSAFVWDVINQKALFQKNAESRRPLASLTKVMTVLAASSIAPSLRYITINLDDLYPEGDSKLKVASKWNMKNLIDYILLVSSNDGAHAIAGSAGALHLNFGSEVRDGSQNVDSSREVFIKEMNRLAVEIGLTKSFFLNEHGLDVAPDKGGAYGSSRDMALLFEYILKNKPHLLEATRYSSLEVSDLSNSSYSASNTNPIINLIPSPLASKTGFTDLAGGNLVVAFDAGFERPIVISILGSSEKGRFTDMLALIESSMEYLQQGE